MRITNSKKDFRSIDTLVSVLTFDISSFILIYESTLIDLNVISINHDYSSFVDKAIVGYSEYEMGYS